MKGDNDCFFQRYTSTGKDNCNLRDDAERAPTPRLVHRKVPAIERKNQIVAVALGQIKQRGIR